MVQFNISQFFQDISGPTNGGVLKLKTGRREVPGSYPSRARQPSPSQFSMVFS